MPKRSVYVNTWVTWLNMPRPMLVIASSRRYVLRPRRRPHANSIPISRKNTGVARTMTWYGDIPGFWAHSNQGASGVNPDDPLDGAAVQPAGRAGRGGGRGRGRGAGARGRPGRAARG